MNWQNNSCKFVLKIAQSISKRITCSRIVLEVVRVCHQVVNDISEYKRLCSSLLRGWPMPTQPPTTLSTGCMPPSSFLIEANTEPRWGYWGCCLPRSSESLRASLPCPPFCGLCVMMTIVVVVLMMMIMRPPTKVCHSIKTLKTGQIHFYMMHHNIIFFSLRLFQIA